MEENTDPTPEQIKAEPLLQLFKHMHLANPALRAQSRQFAKLAISIVDESPRNPERSTALRKLRESKDCAVSALFWQDPAK